MASLKGILGKALTAAAVIGGAAIGVAAVVVVGSLISRKAKAGVPSPESEAPNVDETDIGEVIKDSPQSRGER